MAEQITPIVEEPTKNELVDAISQLQRLVQTQNSTIQELREEIESGSGGGGSDFSGDYSDLTNVPTSFPPEDHNHVLSDITDFPGLSDVATSGSYADLTDRPTSFSGNYSDLSGVPSEFPPEDHQHSADDVTSGEFTYDRLPFSSSNVSSWNTAYDRSVTGVSGSGNGTITISRQGTTDVTTDLSHSHGYGDLPFNSGDVDNWNEAYGWGDFRDYGLGTDTQSLSNTDGTFGTQFFYGSGPTGNNGHFIHVKRTNNYIGQFWLQAVGGRFFTRTREDGDWQSWKEGALIWTTAPRDLDTLYRSGLFRTTGNTSNNPDNRTITGILAFEDNLRSYQIQATADDDLRFRAGEKDGPWNGWRDVWHDGNLRYSTETVNLGGEWGSGSQVKIVRIGDQVTVTSVGVLSHSFDSTIQGSVGDIPSQYRPSGDVGDAVGCSFRLGTNSVVNFVITTGGNTRVDYYDVDTGDGVSRSDTGDIVSVTYNI